ncbi:sn-glycerol-3-phosphate ABC transporter ATP-binding protein UgpC [Sphaerotilus sp.]|uniref:ABC transporter ATP-binding protein n=1 Tax=Sphaerotilus sp. TaxID=2093942 RepID=UPI002ACE3932|nr:sn-glycerol-3-phosphate ABC transporter ATP-binding protein UgpC [Sphaerotilus sp.]MDZ7854643.1 sn-glycerol-3-phosphate ABC transporter ATP-binding protein UgpC [Sphaerotilus sp.]
MASVELQNLRKSFGAHDIIKDVNLRIEHGEFVVFVGPSGCGKSTLLRLIAGLEMATSGTLAIGERIVNDVSPKDRGIAMVFQSYALFPHLTVYENVAFGLNLAGAPKDEVERKVRQAAQILKMEHLLGRKPKELSGGQRQRVAIGRAIVREPEVFLFDEPLSNLDAALRVNTRAEIAKLHRDLGATMVYVTHDQVEAMTLADKIVVLEAGEVRQVGRPLELYHMPRNQFVAGFIGSPKMNFLSVTVTAVDAQGVGVSSPDLGGPHPIPVASGTLRVGDTVTLGIRPEHIAAGAPGPTVHGGIGVQGTVGLVERLGHETFVEITTASGVAVTALVGGTTRVCVTARLPLCFHGDDCHLFAADGMACERLRVPEIAREAPRLAA